MGLSYATRWLWNWRCDQLRLSGLIKDGSEGYSLTAWHVFADVSLFDGDSGGPLVDLKYEVVGTILYGWFRWDSGFLDRNQTHGLRIWT